MEHARNTELIHTPRPLSRCSLTSRYVYQPKARYRSRKLILMQRSLEQKVLTTRSDRVKALDFHPTEPYVLAGL